MAGPVPPAPTRPPPPPPRPVRPEREPYGTLDFSEWSAMFGDNLDASPSRALNLTPHHQNYPTPLTYYDPPPLNYPHKYGYETLTKMDVINATIAAIEQKAKNPPPSVSLKARFKTAASLNRRGYIANCSGAAVCKLPLCDHSSSRSRRSTARASPNASSSSSSAAAAPTSSTPTAESEMQRKMVEVMIAKCKEQGYPFSEEYTRITLAQEKWKLLPAMTTAKTDIDTREKRFKKMGRVNFEQEIERIKPTFRNEKTRDEVVTFLESDDLHIRQFSVHGWDSPYGVAIRHEYRNNKSMREHAWNAMMAEANARNKRANRISELIADGCVGAALQGALEAYDEAHGIKKYQAVYDDSQENDVNNTDPTTDQQDIIASSSNANVIPAIQPFPPPKPEVPEPPKHSTKVPVNLSPPEAEVFGRRLAEMETQLAINGSSDDTAGSVNQAFSSSEEIDDNAALLMEDDDFEVSESWESEDYESSVSHQELSERSSREALTPFGEETSQIWKPKRGPLIITENQTGTKEGFKEEILQDFFHELQELTEEDKCQIAYLLSIRTFGGGNETSTSWGSQISDETVRRLLAVLRPQWAQEKEPKYIGKGKGRATEEDENEDEVDLAPIRLEEDELHIFGLFLLSTPLGGRLLSDDLCQSFFHEVCRLTETVSQEYRVTEDNIIVPLTNKEKERRTELLKPRQRRDSESLFKTMSKARVEENIAKADAIQQEIKRAEQIQFALAEKDRREKQYGHKVLNTDWTGQRAYLEDFRRTMRLEKAYDFELAQFVDLVLSWTVKADRENKDASDFYAQSTGAAGKSQFDEVSKSIVKILDTNSHDTKPNVNGGTSSLPRMTSSTNGESSRSAQNTSSSSKNGTSTRSAQKTSNNRKTSRSAQKNSPSRTNGESSRSAQQSSPPNPVEEMKKYQGYDLKRRILTHQVIKGCVSFDYPSAPSAPPGHVFDLESEATREVIRQAQHHFEMYESNIKTITTVPLANFLSRTVDNLWRRAIYASLIVCHQGLDGGRISHDTPSAALYKRLLNAGSPELPIYPEMIINLLKLCNNDIPNSVKFFIYFCSLFKPWFKMYKKIGHPGRYGLELNVFLDEFYEARDDATKVGFPLELLTKNMIEESEMIGF